MIYLQLFFSFLQIGALSFGGGYAAMPLIQEQVVTMHGWLFHGNLFGSCDHCRDDSWSYCSKFRNLCRNQDCGSWRRSGGYSWLYFTLLYNCNLLAYIYTKYRKMSLLQGTLISLRPAVVAMIAKAGVTILVSSFFINGALELFRENICIRMVVFFTAALVLLRKFKMNPILVMVLCGVANMVFCAAVGS